MVIKNFEALNLSLEHFCNFCCVSLSVVSSITRDICNKERRGLPIGIIDNGGNRWDGLDKPGWPSDGPSGLSRPDWR